MEKNLKRNWEKSGKVQGNNERKSRVYSSKYQGTYEEKRREIEQMRVKNKNLIEIERLKVV